jgi:hypothetical protein
MKVYRNGYRRADNEHCGYSFHTTKAEAALAARAEKEDGSSETEVFEIEISKAGIMRALTILATHPDNG